MKYASKPINAPQATRAIIVITIARKAAAGFGAQQPINNGTNYFIYLT